jgi:hypothetical protein
LAVRDTLEQLDAETTRLEASRNDAAQCQHFDPPDQKRSAENAQIADREPRAGRGSIS